MNLRLMGIYCKVVEKGVMSHAADELGMTAAAITKAVAELEDKLGTRLLQRTTRHLQMTDAGKKYFAACKQLLAQADDLHQEFSQLSTEVKGTLRLTAPMSYGLSQLPKIISQFKKKYPEVHLDLHLEDRTVDLIEGGFDLGLRIQMQMKDSTLIAKSFGSFRIHAVATKSYLSKAGRIRRPKDLEGHKILSYSLASDPNRWSFTNSNGKTSFSFTPDIQVNNSLMLKELLLMDHGVGLFPAFLIEEEIQKGRVEQILPNYDLGSAQGWLVYPSRKYTPRTVSAFVEFFTTRERRL